MYEAIVLDQLDRASKALTLSHYGYTHSRPDFASHQTKQVVAHLELASRALGGMKGNPATCALENKARTEFRFYTPTRFVAYAATFRNEYDEEVDCVGEKILRNAFRRDLVLNGDRRPLYFQHDYLTPIGAATYLHEDARGLKFTGELDPQNPFAMEIRDALQANVLSECSIGYWVEETKAKNIITRIKLVEVSVVTKACDWKAGAAHD
jgi:HK97 family phage prohead protease